MAKPTDRSPPSAPTIQFSPAIPMPAIFDVPKRIQELHSYLDPNNPQCQPEQQHANIKAAIKLYEDGKIDGLQHVFIMEGKLATKEQVFKGSARAWGEGRYHQYAQKCAYGHGPFGPHCQEVQLAPNAAQANATPRGCPGRSFAEQEIILSFAVMASTFDMELLDGGRNGPVMPDMKYYGWARSVEGAGSI